MINKFLSLSIWIPLSRLTFATYLVHTLVLISYYSSQEHTMHLQDYSAVYNSNVYYHFKIYHFTYFNCFKKQKVYNFIGNMFISFGFGYLVSMVFEVPLLGLEKFVFKRH